MIKKSKYLSVGIVSSAVSFSVAASHVSNALAAPPTALLESQEAQSSARSTASSFAPSIALRFNASAPAEPAPTNHSAALRFTAVDDGDHGAKSPATANLYATLGLFSGPALLGLAAAVDHSGGSDGVVTGLGVLTAVGFVAGPSAGRWYVGETGVGLLAARGVGAGLMIFGARNAVCLRGCDDPSTANIAMVAGFGTYLAAALYDAATAGDRARAYNRRHHRTAVSNLTFAPLVQRSENTAGTTATTTGLMLGGSF